MFLCTITNRKIQKSLCCNLFQSVYLHLLDYSARRNTFLAYDWGTLSSISTIGTAGGGGREGEEERGRARKRRMRRMRKRRKRRMKRCLQFLNEAVKYDYSVTIFLHFITGNDRHSLDYCCPAGLLPIFPLTPPLPPPSTQCAADPIDAK